MRKKGISLSMNTIIIAALGLTVLIVLIVIFTGNTKNFVIGTKSCEAKRGTCMPLIQCTNNDGVIYRNTDCDNLNQEGMQITNDNYQVCCVNFL